MAAQGSGFGDLGGWCPTGIGDGTHHSLERRERPSHPVSKGSAPSTGVDSTLEKDVFALLDFGVSLDRIEAFFEARGTEPTMLRTLTKKWISCNPQGAHKITVAHDILQRGVSGLAEPKFRDQLLTWYTDPDLVPERFTDPITFALMEDPVVLSTGFVVDRSTALHESGDLRLNRCPFTRDNLMPIVYPLQPLKSEVRLSTLQSLDSDNSCFDSIGLISFLLQPLGFFIPEWFLDAPAGACIPTFSDRGLDQNGGELA